MRGAIAISAGRRAHPRGCGYRNCDVCGKRAIYASETIVDDLELRDRDRSGTRRFKAGVIVCNYCLEQNPEHSHAVRPMPVPTTRRVRRRRGMRRGA